MKASIGMFLLMLLTMRDAQAQDAFVGWFAFDTGFGVPVAANTAVKLATGQSFVGTQSSVNTRIESGFLTNPLLHGPVLSVGETRDLPNAFALGQNFPNPFNPSTTIKYELPRASHVTLTVYDVLGREVTTLVSGAEEPGYKSVRLDATGLSSGIYFYRLTAGGCVQTKKMLVIK
jgi:hypothetical protein